MMNKLFNTPFEMSLRIVIILSEYQGSPLSADMIAITDFISIYAKALGLADRNLHGDSSFKFSEFASKRELVQQALKNLVADGLITVECNEEGFVYFLNENGLRYAEAFESKYVNNFKEIIWKSKEYTNELSERELLSMINKASIRSIKEGGFN